MGEPASSQVAADKLKPRSVVNRRKTNQTQRGRAASKERPKETETAGNNHRASHRRKEATKGLRKRVSREMPAPEMGLVGTGPRMAASAIAAPAP